MSTRDPAVLKGIIFNTATKFYKLGREHLQNSYFLTIKPIKDKELGIEGKEFNDLLEKFYNVIDENL